MSATYSIASIHSIEKAKERAGLCEKRAHKSIELALERGKSADSFSSREHKYLERLSRDGCTAIAFNGFCFIVGKNGRCVTLFPLPIWFGKKKNFDGKEKVRNVKKYSKSHDSYVNESELYTCYC